MAPVSSSPLPPTPSHVGAHPTTSPLPDSTLDPATNQQPLSPSPAGPVGHSRLASQVGRSKSQRWSDSSSTPTSSSDRLCSTPGSYKEVVLSGSKRGTRSPPHVPSARAPLAPASRASSPVLQGRTLGRQQKDEDGWILVERRKRHPAGVLPPRRGSQVDLRGRCYNCLSASHLVAACCHPTRCFKCLKLGHQAAWCTLQPESKKRTTVWQRLSHRGPRPSVWQRLSSMDWATPSREVFQWKTPVWRRIAPPLDAAALASDEEQVIVHNKRKRRHSKKGRGALEHKILGAQVFEALHVPPCSPAVAPGGPSPAPVTNTPSCVVEFSTAMAREEVNLRRGVGGSGMQFWHRHCGYDNSSVHA
jgi:hypothetical protein